MNRPPATWCPPSATLEWHEGLWRARTAAPISYPSAANDAFFQIEDRSYWFAHRLDCILATVRRLPPDGDLFDVGGGNGYVSRGLELAGWPTVLVEPGPGARNAVRRGVTRVIQATLQEAGLSAGGCAAAGAFDVIEHIEDDTAFVRLLRSALRPGGRFYCTVPAGPALWSHADVVAGHYRRYTRETLAALLTRGGLRVEFCSPFFSWLVPPLALLRAVPRRSQRKSDPYSPRQLAADHTLPRPVAPFVRRIHAWELARLAAGRALPGGTSLLAVARAE